MLLAALAGGGSRLVQTWAAEVREVAGRAHSFQETVLGERSSAAEASQVAARLVPSTRRPGRSVPNVGEWADRVGVPVLAATPHTHVSSPFGPRVHPVWGGIRTHTGVDFAAPRGTPVSATASGVVVAAGRLGGYGLRVDVRHPRSGLTTRYAHLDRIAPGLRVGRPLHRGALVGFVGATGVVTGPHLHYEVRDPSGTPVDPAALARRYQADWARARLAYEGRAREAHPPRPVRVPPMRVPGG